MGGMELETLVSEGHEAIASRVARAFTTPFEVADANHLQLMVSASVGLAYAGPGDLSGIAALELQRDDTVFDGRFRLFEVMHWIDADAQGSPLPPIAGVLKTPALEISGATLEGVEVRLEDPSLPATAAGQ